MIDDADLDRALTLLPSPLFRGRDIDAAARRLGASSVTLWAALERRGLIVRTTIPIGNFRARFYWERTPGSLPTRNTQHERRIAMPTYLGKAVSDEYMQGLVEGYRDGQRLQGGEAAVEDGDQKIIDRLAETRTITERAAVVQGYNDAKGKGVEE